VPILWRVPLLFYVRAINSTLLLLPCFACCVFVDDTGWLAGCSEGPCLLACLLWAKHNKLTVNNEKGTNERQPFFPDDEFVCLINAELAGGDLRADGRDSRKLISRSYYNAN